MSRLLEVRDLRTEFRLEEGTVRAVDGISYHVDEGEVVGLVGESGCGKSAGQRSVLQLVAKPGKIVGGEVLFEGVDLLQCGPESEQMRAVRGGKIGMIFQEPMTSLNPVLTIGQQIVETLVLHLKLSKRAARERTVELLGLMGIPDPAHRIDEYPHQFSGGMRQRVMVAIAFACHPRLLIADEPTTALDVTTQAQLLELLREKVREFHTAMLIVTHNLGVVARYADRIYVMYAGRIVESGRTREIFARPSHPYTVGLLRSVPRLDEPKGAKLVPIRGVPPNLSRMPDRCAFWPRCDFRGDECARNPPPELRRVDVEHEAACLRDGLVREEVARGR
ncbi:MAG: ABC transporter ATP-binding protein [Deltaproteobacteria bacterium]|nr:ABC transporter ATP-binding protein [Deltaproteobacteria bacterium]